MHKTTSTRRNNNDEEYLGIHVYSVNKKAYFMANIVTPVYRVCSGL